MTNKKTVLFHRDFSGFTGGHLKVWDYYQHVLLSKDYKPEIYFTPESVWSNNPWSELRGHCLTEWNPNNADVLFLAGMDWLALTEDQRLNPPAPVINFIQHVRHADRQCPLYEFLKYPALRICVSQEVTDAIKNTGIINGSVITNTNGIDLTELPTLIEKDIPLLIAGLKNPVLANEIYGRLMEINIPCRVITQYLPRKDYLSLLARAEVALFLPNNTEGFYLPALEAMYLKTLVICPDCIGNRGFCIDGETCFKPKYNVEKIIQAIKHAFSLSENKQDALLKKGYEISKKATLFSERDAFLHILSTYGSDIKI